MANPADAAVRTFKTAWFAKAARKAHIHDEELCSAIRQVILGQADDLGGGVFKKRLRKNQYRSIVLANAARFWVYEYLFAKQDRADIEADELSGLAYRAPKVHLRVRLSSPVKPERKKVAETGCSNY